MSKNEVMHTYWKCELCGKSVHDYAHPCKKMKGKADVDWEKVVYGMLSEFDKAKARAKSYRLSALDKFAKYFKNNMEDLIALHTHKTSPARRRRVHKRNRSA